MDLLNFDSAPVVSNPNPSGNALQDIFSSMPAAQQDDGFSDF
jgi:hypothetical protein